MFRWDNFPAREQATWDFCRRFWKLAPDKQQDIMKDPQKAKEMFAEGWFYWKGDPLNPNPPLLPIPAETEFRISKSDDLPGADNLVVLQVPPANTPLPPPARLTVPIEEVFRCTWFPYLTHRTSLSKWRRSRPAKRAKTKSSQRKKSAKTKAR